MLREARPNLKIGFFLHIPFPSSEIFRTFPWREELLHGLLGASLIGFHTYDYVRHFLNSVKRISGLEVKFNQIAIDDRTVRVDSFPMGIDYAHFNEAAREHSNREEHEKQELRRRIEAHRDQFTNSKLILSIDRLDYSKGIPLRIRAFEYFLDKYPMFREKVRLVMLAVPSRTNVPQYQQLKKETDELVGRINGKFATINWTPIWYFYRSLPFDDLIALYGSAQVAFISPIRDGMNLVAKEYVASRVNSDGVLVLSEMAGAAAEMQGALLINPNNFEHTAQILKQALEMPLDEQKLRMKAMQDRLSRYDVSKWAAEFMTALKDTLPGEAQSTAQLSEVLLAGMIADFEASQNKILMLDYDGTLTGFRDNPLDASPDAALFDLLDALSALPGTDVAIVSGRSRETLESWFGEKNYTLITDHGVWIYHKGCQWEETERMRSDWKSSIMPILETFVDRTPGAFVEEKQYSIAWHYRKSDPELANLRSMELKTVLHSLISNNGLSILEGNKVIEIKSSFVNKGRSASRLLAQNSYDFIFAIGDDWTDEYLFEELPESAYSVKVGSGKTAARYYVSDQTRVRNLLSGFLNKS